jgi:hypothetical protein
MRERERGVRRGERPFLFLSLPPNQFTFVTTGFSEISCIFK